MVKSEKTRNRRDGYCQLPMTEVTACLPPFRDECISFAKIFMFTPNATQSKRPADSWVVWDRLVPQNVGVTHCNILIQPEWSSPTVDFAGNPAHLCTRNLLFVSQIWDSLRRLRIVFLVVEYSLLQHGHRLSDTRMGNDIRGCGYPDWIFWLCHT